MMKNRYYIGLFLLIFCSNAYAQLNDYRDERNCEQYQFFEMFIEDAFQNKIDSALNVNTELNANWRWIENIDIILMERMYNFAYACTPIGYFEKLFDNGEN